MAGKLGKLAPKFHPKTLAFDSLVQPGTLPTPATKVFREYKTPVAAQQMYGNDQYGDCVWAMLANHIILTTCHTGTVVIPTIQDVLGAYSAVTGFDPKTGANDNGTDITTALDYMRTTGVAGHKILAWAKIDHTNLVHRQLGVDWFAGTCVGVQLPYSASIQFNSKQPWELVRSSIEGGHAILHPGYGSLGDDYVTWANWFQKASSAWSARYIDEEYVIITEDWLNKVTEKTPGGLNLDALTSLLKQL